MKGNVSLIFKLDVDMTFYIRVKSSEISNCLVMDLFIIQCCPFFIGTFIFLFNTPLNVNQSFTFLETVLFQFFFCSLFFQSNFSYICLKNRTRKSVSITPERSYDWLLLISYFLLSCV